MTTVPAAYAQFGYTLAFAERTLSAVLREHLAERGTEPETWYALQLLAARGERSTVRRSARSSRGHGPWMPTRRATCSPGLGRRG